MNHNQNQVTVTIEGIACEVRYGQRDLTLADGRRVAMNWKAGFPPAFDGYEFLAAPPEHRLLWRGKLATGGRTAEEFDAEIVETATGPVILRRRGLTTQVISPAEIRGESWMRALLAMTNAPR